MSQSGLRRTRQAYCSYRSRETLIAYGERQLLGCGKTLIRYGGRQLLVCKKTLSSMEEDSCKYAGRPLLVWRKTVASMQEDPQ